MNDSAADNDFVIMGKIVGTHGVRGTLKVYSYAEDPAVFAAGLRLRVEPPGSKKPQEVVLISASPHKQVLLMAVEGIDTRDQAEALVGALVQMPRAALPALEEDEFYWFDIIGLHVVDTARGPLGKVEAIMPTGANDVYVVREGDTETLVPAVEAVIVEIDLERRQMTVTLPDGL